MGGAMRTSGLGGEGQKYALTSDKDDSDFWGFAHEAEGLFTPLPGEEGARRVHLAGIWYELAPEDRHAWLSVALWSREYQRQGKPDASAGQVFTLDGRHVVDRDTFYCAIGEAINGPGGYFGCRQRPAFCQRQNTGPTGLDDHYSPGS
ncbi:hypothetical protein [Streptomyces acidicola]|uniref:hypothetical protein n=1 Tax=Streptomyces acidicola TaxID=2596892 RepID=UPI001D13A99C|nr:hypothetical protein [Streptomyces acidicola]